MFICFSDIFSKPATKVLLLFHTRKSASKKNAFFFLQTFSKTFLYSLRGLFFTPQNSAKKSQKTPKKIEKVAFFSHQKKHQRTNGFLAKIILVFSITIPLIFLHLTIDLTFRVPYSNFAYTITTFCASCVESMQKTSVRCNRMIVSYKNILKKEKKLFF